MDVLCRGSDSLEPCRVVLAGILQKTDTVPVDEGRAGGTREGVVGALSVMRVDGVTGPLAYGWEEDRALNLVFSGTPEENAETARKIRRLTYTDSKRRIVEYGKFWPLRLAHDGVPVCCFFVYADRGRIPVCGQGIELVREPVEAFGTVVDTLHSLYMPLVLRLGDAYLDGAPAGEIDLIIADSSLRGEFYPNERVHITRGRLVRLSGNGASAEAIVALDAGDIEKERFVKGVPAF